MPFVRDLIPGKGPTVYRMHAEIDPLDPSGDAPIGHARAHSPLNPGGLVGPDRLFLVIAGEPASKANSRQIVVFGKRPAIIKSKKAREYEKGAKPQILSQVRRAGWLCRLTGTLRLTIRIWYATERPDLDESIVLDVMQGVVYGNDRQVRERHVYHAIDQTN